MEEQIARAQNRIKELELWVKEYKKQKQKQKDEKTT